MECICVPEYFDLGNIQDLAVFEPPAINATDELNNPHLTAFIPHVLDDCPPEDGNPTSHNDNHTHNNNHREPIPKRVPSRHHDKEEKPEKKDADDKGKERDVRVVENPSSLLKEPAMNSQKNEIATSPDVPQQKQKRMHTGAIFSLNLLIILLIAGIGILSFRKLEG